MGSTIATLNELAASWSASILRATWQGALAIMAAGILIRCGPGLPPRVACWVWRMVDLKLVVALLWATPLLLPLLRATAPLEPRPHISARAPDLPQGGIVDWEPSTFLARGPAATTTFHRPSPTAVLLLLWLSGVVGAAVMAGREGFAVIRLRRSCGLIDRPELRDAMIELARVFGLRSVPELRAGPTVARPMVVGALRPTILLPVKMLADLRSTVAIRPILAHELAHFWRRDLWWSGLTGLVRAIFFFHPLVWLAHRESHLAREAACDALALWASGVRRSEYGRILLDIATGNVERTPWWAATLGIAGSAGSLKRRLIAMKTIQQPSRRRLLSWAIALLAVGAVGIIPWKLVPREVPAKEPPPVLPGKEPAPAGHEEQAPAEWYSRLNVVEARVGVAQAQRKVAQDLLRQAEAEAVAAAAEREYRWDQHDRIVQFEKTMPSGVERRLIDEEEERYRLAQAAERVAELKTIVSRASLDAVTAAVREAQAQRDITRAQEARSNAAAGGAPTPTPRMI